MKCKQLSILFFLLVSSILFSQKKLSALEINQLQDLVAKNAANTKSLSANFKEEKHIDVLNNTVVSKGVLRYLSPDKIKWEYQSPIANTTIIKGDRLYNNDGNEEKVINLQKNKVFRQFKDLIINSISGNLFDESLFNIAYFKSSKSYQAIFQPKNTRIKKLIATIEITFNINNAEVECIKLIENDKNFTMIEFVDRQINITIDNSEFEP